MVSILAAIAFVGCGAQDSETSAGCILPPAGFSDRDLLGRWTSPPNPDSRFDILVFREDGLYKQIIHLDSPEYDYESGWLPWRIEYADDGVPYLYLTGMRLYAYLPGLLERGVVGGGDRYFLDWCRPVEMPGGKQIFQGIQMPPGEGVLTVHGVPSRFAQPPRGIRLELLAVSDNYGWYYELEE
jgi:hypothetical protein